MWSEIAQPLMSLDFASSAAPAAAPAAAPPRRPSLSVGQLFRWGRLPSPVHFALGGGSRLLEEARLLDFECDAGDPMVVLDLRGLGLTSLEGLSELAFIREVNVLLLSNNAIAELPAGVFATAPHLRQLSLDHNLLSCLAAGAFSAGGGGLEALQALNLSCNAIAEIAPEVFTGLEHLTTLRLNRNRLTRIAARTFGAEMAPPRPDLDLDLSYNAVSFIEPGSFSVGQPVPIASLLLAHNELSEIPGVLGELDVRETLNLSHNRIATLPKDAFSGQLRAWTIDLSHNALRALPRLFGGGSARLCHFRAIGNAITEVAADAFAGAASVQTFDLVGNQPTGLHPGTFASNAELRFVYL